MNYIYIVLIIFKFLITIMMIYVSRRGERVLQDLVKVGSFRYQMISKCYHLININRVTDP